MSIRGFDAGLALGAIFFLAQASLAAAGEAEKKPGLKLEISAEETTIPEGALPKVKAVIVNCWDKEVILIHPGDGSNCGWRTPRVGWSVLPLDEKRAHPLTPPQVNLPRCGNMSPMRADEVFTLHPGEAKELNEWKGNPFDYRPVPPGKYRIVFYYSNLPETVWRGLWRGHNPEAKKVQGSTPCELVSNELVFTVLAKVEKKEE